MRVVILLSLLYVILNSFELSSKNNILAQSYQKPQIYKNPYIDLSLYNIHQTNNFYTKLKSHIKG
ncbi:MAG: hypothetical protein MR376_03170 [Campylobacter lanienae]|uniref:hypothetical protein n=1 Tax=Campylobacter lanienae TaxID=75658 RepID=UPI0024309531|nr:hypothetical protein [Campylobacter lanienae]MCI5539564.1 hypothetical protein [Campylobacter lanienae]